ncbi:hypothetical protein [Modicisalibacter luteus]|uniref:Uncharacterized protein n=1 Tax=Modicisalibacter luteus TaxID=453962 RepID=A0ABV7M392_9GAMM|nr:hypothetical protein [Halomonas lutea]GHB14543.1 hypothetical protein GCM10007159_41140 [Halomonas lutea]
MQKHLSEKQITNVFKEAKTGLSRKELHCKNWWPGDTRSVLAQDAGIGKHA